jgi:hypothetical protein
MYHPTVGVGAGVAGAGAGLPATGLAPMSILWIMLAAFALLSVGGAVLRVAPSLHRSPGAPVRRAAVRPGRR